MAKGKKRPRKKQYNEQYKKNQLEKNSKGDPVIDQKVRSTHTVKISFLQGKFLEGDVNKIQLKYMIMFKTIFMCWLLLRY